MPSPTSALGCRVQTLHAGTPIGPVAVDAAALALGVYVVRVTGATAQAARRISSTR